jgi:hypothetical protein
MVSELVTTPLDTPRHMPLGDRPVREGVSKGEEDGRRPPALRAGHPPNGRKAVWVVAHPQGV